MEGRGVAKTDVQGLRAPLTGAAKAPSAAVFAAFGVA